MRNAPFLTLHHDAVLRVANNTNLPIELLWFTVWSANVFGQLPQGGFLLQFVAREIERCEHLVDTAFVRFQAQNNHLLALLLEETSNRTCRQFRGLLVTCAYNKKKLFVCAFLTQSDMSTNVWRKVPLHRRDDANRYRLGTDFLGTTQHVPVA